MGKYFSLSSLPSEMVANMEAKAMDFGATMMAGVESDVLGQANVVGNTIDKITGGAENLVGTASTALLNAPDLAKDLANQVLDDMISQISTYLGNVVDDLLKLPTMGDIMASAQKQLSSYLMTPGDIMKELTETSEDMIKSASENVKTDKLNSFISKTTKKVEKFKGKVDKIVETANTYISVATSYIEQGPTWVEEQIDIAEGLAMDQVHETMGSLTEEVNKEKQKVVDLIGQGVAKVMAKPINKAQKDLLQKQMNKIKNEKTKATIKAKAAIGNAILKLMGKLGV